MGIYCIASLTGGWYVGITSRCQRRLGTVALLSTLQRTSTLSSFISSDGMAVRVHSQSCYHVCISAFFQWNVEICVCKRVRPSPRGHLTHSLISGHEFHSLVLTRSTLQHRKALLPQSKSSWLFYAAWGCEFWTVFQHTWRVLEFYFYNVDINSWKNLCFMLQPLQEVKWAVVIVGGVGGGMVVAERGICLPSTAWATRCPLTCCWKTLLRCSKDWY